MYKFQSLIFFLLLLIVSCQVDKTAQNTAPSITKHEAIVNPSIMSWQDSARAEYGDWPDSVLLELVEMDSIMNALDALGITGIDYEQEAVYLQQVDDVQTADLALWHKTKPRQFKRQQQKFYKVQDIYEYNEDYIQKLLVSNGIYSYNIDLYLRAFKKEGRIEVWAKAKGNKQYKLLLDYPFYQGESKLGPKQREGDLQVPEGFYHIEYFNPESAYKVSMRINYPNAADSIRNVAEPLMGGAICIHGHYGSIGCLAITDLRIPNVYLLATEAFDKGQTKIPVHIFPTKMTLENMDTLQQVHASDTALIAFWESLAPAYDYFEQTQELPTMLVQSDGSYQLDKNP